MSYTPMGLGYVMEVTLPYVGKEKITVPLEEMVDVATDRAMKRAMPEIRHEVTAAMAEARNMAATIAEEVWSDVSPQVEAKGKQGLAVVGLMVAAGAAATILFLRR
jgi:uncharacterized protein (UPF0218 family)